MLVINISKRMLVNISEGILNLVWSSH